MSRIVFRIDPELKKKFENYCEMNNQTMTRVLNNYVIQVILEQEKKDYIEDSKGNVYFRYK